VNLTLTLGIILLSVVGLAIVIEVYRLLTAKRRRKAKAASAPPARLPQLERRMAEVFSGPRKTCGECFAEFSVWRQFETVRMDVWTKGPWQSLSLFTQQLIMRHLWRGLEKLSRKTVLVNIDPGTPRALVWSAATNAEFNDGGVPDPWSPAKGRVGTLISGS
jgi:hypothetical protein